ncbi:MarR family transcriptional regulator [Clostridium sp. OS1-26]|uniref:MarR family winged helix-turn-helix transcriptional regulator n=1 Tax=Clostridium sp. OS1-26 TaxID=3070681 RepID=UPI0027DF0271|nr:MarR family transcriptional regulator [Clostridium sp. OS1-26]WML36774.1 MarR family transcriptional regulator [Clostridium sp. OS1-26]
MTVNNNSPETDQMRLIEIIIRLGSLIQQLFDEFYKTFKLTKTQFTALYKISLAGEEGIALSVLGEQMSVTRANITSLVDRMVARGIIVRSMNENDRRSIKAVITKEGKEILERVMPNSEVFSSEVLSFLTENEKENFYELLNKVEKYVIANYFEK